MRRVLLFAAFLLLLGLTTATAASFEVQAEDITSFSLPVDLAEPPPPVLYLVDNYKLSAELNSGPNSQGISAPETLSWQSDPLESGRPIQGAVVVLEIDTTGAGGADSASAEISECSGTNASLPCTLLAVAAPKLLTTGPNLLPFTVLSTVTDEVKPGYRLRLTVKAEAGMFNIKWGKPSPDQDSRLMFSGP